MLNYGFIGHGYEDHLTKQEVDIQRPIVPNCLITFSINSVTLQYQRMGRTIDIGHESHGLFHLSSSSCSAFSTSIDAPLLIHSRLGHPSISKFRKMVTCFSSLP